MKWEDLDYKQKGQLAKIYLSNGITSLDAMKNHYNTFATGGEMNPDDDKIYTISEETEELLDSYADLYPIRPYTAKLHTAKFLNPQYKIGHSWLEAYPEQGNDMMSPYVSRKARISKGFKDSGYNLITNNCSDATAKALGIPSNGITTPLNVRNYVLNNFSDVTQSKDINGVDMLTFPISKAQYERILAANLSQKKDNLVDLINKQIDVQDYSYNLLNNYIDRINALGYIGNEFATGGKIYIKPENIGKITPYGQWQYPHQVTTIPSNNITMKGVNYPVLGVSDTGDTKYMLPNTDYLFDGNYVTEYPLHTYQGGGPIYQGFLPTVYVEAPQPVRTQEFEEKVQRERSMYYDAMRHFNSGNQDTEGLQETYTKYPELRSYLKRMGISERDFMSAATGRIYETDPYEVERTRAFNKEIQADKAAKANAIMYDFQHNDPNDRRLATALTGILGLGTGAGILEGMTQVGQGLNLLNTAKNLGQTYIAPVVSTIDYPKAIATLIGGTMAAEGVDSVISDKSNGYYTGLPNYLNQNFFDGNGGTELALEFFRPEYGAVGTGAKLLDRGVEAASKLPMYIKEFPSLAKALKSDIKLELGVRRGLRNVDRAIRGDIGRGNLLVHEEDYLPRTKLYFEDDVLKAAHKISEAAKRIKILNNKHPNDVAARRLHSKDGGDNLGRIGRQGENKDVITLQQLNDTKKVNGSISYPITFDGVSGHRTLHGKWEFNPIIPAPNTSAEHVGWNYRISDGRIPAGKTITGLTTRTQISENVRSAVTKRFEEATALAGEDGIVVGSTRTISSGAVNDVPHDIEFFTTAKRVNSLQKKIKFTKTGDTANNTGITGTSKYGATDINIINTDGNGNAVGTQTEQILQTLYPEEFAAYKQSLVDAGVESFTFPKIKNGKFVYDLKNPEKGARLTDEDVYQLMRDDNNAYNVLVNDMFSSIKAKHIDRANNLLFDENRTGQVRSILDRLGRSKMGDSYQTIEQMYPNLRFSDVEANKEFLKMLNLPETYADNPEIMRNLAQRYAIISEYVTRGVDRAPNVPLKDMLITNYAYDGGSWSGPGGNTLRSGYDSDAGVSAKVVGIMRSRYTTHPENVKTLGDYTKAIERARSRTVETALGTPAGEKLINDIFKQNGITLNQPIPQQFDNTSIQWTDWVKDVVYKTENNSKKADEKTKKIIDEVSKALDSPRVDTHGYSGTYTGTLELPTDLRMRHNSKNSATYQRGSLEEVDSNNILLFDDAFADPLMQDVQKMFAEKGFAYVPGKGLVVVSSKAPQSVLKYIEKRQQMFPYQEHYPYTYTPYDIFSEPLERWEKKITEARDRESFLIEEHQKIKDAYRALQEFFNSKIGVDLGNKKNRELIEAIYGRIPERVKTYNKREETRRHVNNLAVWLTVGTGLTAGGWYRYKHLNEKAEQHKKETIERYKSKAKVASSNE